MFIVLGSAESSTLDQQLHDAIPAAIDCSLERRVSFAIPRVNGSSAVE
jgi:hypothetical protein